MPDPVDRDDFDGLGKRVSEDREEFVDCRANKGARLTTVETAIVNMTNAQTKIFEGQSSINIKLATLAGSLKVWGIVAIVASPILGAAAAVILGKVL